MKCPVNYKSMKELFRDLPNFGKTEKDIYVLLTNDREYCWSWINPDEEEIEEMRRWCWWY